LQPEKGARPAFCPAIARDFARRPPFGQVEGSRLWGLASGAAAGPNRLTMLNATTVFAAAIGYVLAMFALAWWGDHGGRRFLVGGRRKLVYALSLAVYCTSWTYYGSVGVASAHGLDFLPIYIGPVLVIGFGHRLVARIVALSRAQNLTSVADFVAARYGKSQLVAALCAFIALMAAAPYMALQVKAITRTLALVASPVGGRLSVPSPQLALLVTLLLALFAMAFGTRRLNPAERQDGLMLAVAAESLVKLVAFVAVGIFAVWGLSGGPGALLALAQTPEIASRMTFALEPANWLVVTALSASAALLLPRQFHVTIVENADPADIATARWLFPAYLVAINLFVLPLAVAGLAAFPDPNFDRDLTVLALPLHAGAPLLALATMIGGVSAATAMAVVESVALAITISNNLVMPVLLRWPGAQARAAAGEIGALILYVRRFAILGVLALGYLYTRLASDAALAAFGLLSFAAVAQIAPAFLAALFWRRGTAAGAAAGMILGSLAWVYLLFLPSLDAGSLTPMLSEGGHWLAGAQLASLGGYAPSPYVGGAALSVGLNVLAFAAVSLWRQPTLLERTQALAFVGDGPLTPGHAFRLWRSTATVGDLEATVARFLGAARARRAFDALFVSRGVEKRASAEADAMVIRHAEHLLSPVIGASTSRLVLSLLLKRRALSGESALKMLDDASAAMQTSRDRLQHALDHARQGISVFDANLGLLAWNRAFAELFDLPPAMLRDGLGLDAIVRFNALRGLYGEGPSDDFVAERISSLLDRDEPIRLRLKSPPRVLEIRSARLPDGGIVTTYADISETVAFEDELAAANESLERRVGERTAELERLNGELARAKTSAEEANLSKTRFLAAAGHDILQPLNAARLYASSLVETAADAPAEERVQLSRNIDSSLEAVEEILGALLDISRLDAGATRPEIGDVSLAQVFGQLEIEFAPMARAKGLKLTFAPTRLAVRSDRRLLRRLLQNFVSNAVKYTPRGRVLVGVRRAGEQVRIEVWDTGLGIPETMRARVFEEFHRLDQGAKVARGLGLGLSIVQRLARVLGHPIRLDSTPGRGSLFAVTVPLSRAAVAAAPVEAAPVFAQDPLAGLKVLAIDNEPRVLEGMRTLIGKWGAQVSTAGGLEEALERLDPPPDIVIADYHLDDGDGLAAIAAIRARLGAGLPAVLATAERGADLRAACEAAHVALLYKPVKPAPLRALLTRGLALRAAAE
jgi:Na+/proline symporter/signal transduction histidine kinase/CheY-like chemotaxis protein